MSERILSFAIDTQSKRKGFDVYRPTALTTVTITYEMHDEQPSAFIREQFERAKRDNANFSQTVSN